METANVPAVCPALLIHSLGSEGLIGTATQIVSVSARVRPRMPSAPMLSVILFSCHHMPLGYVPSLAVMISPPKHLQRGWQRFELPLPMHILTMGGPVLG